MTTKSGGQHVRAKPAPSARNAHTTTGSRGVCAHQVCARRPAPISEPAPCDEVPACGGEPEARDCQAVQRSTWRREAAAREHTSADCFVQSRDATLGRDLPLQHNPSSWRCHTFYASARTSHGRLPSTKRDSMHPRTSDLGKDQQACWAISAQVAEQRKIHMNGRVQASVRRSMTCVCAQIVARDRCCQYVCDAKNLTEKIYDVPQYCAHRVARTKATMCAPELRQELPELR